MGSVALRESHAPATFAKPSVTVVRRNNAWTAECAGNPVASDGQQGIDALLSTLEQRGIFQMTIEL